MRLILLACSTAALSVFSFLSVYAAPPALAAPIEPKRVAAAAPNKNLSSNFAIKLFHLTANSPAKNIVISPYSISSSLSMVYNGAAGKTKSQMQSVLGYNALTDHAVNELNSSLAKDLMSVNPASDLTIANAIFAERNIKFKNAFIRTNQKYSKAKLETLDFAAPSSLTKINNWAKENTKGKIPTILDQLSPQARVYLLNAVYFKGLWREKFDKSKTKLEKFRLLDGSNKNVQMMNRDDKIGYFQDNNFQAVSLPYNDLRLQMYIFLPAKNTNIASFIDSCTNANWQKWRSRFENSKGHLGLPRFKVEYRTELTDVLAAAGMPCAFEPHCADFKNMSDENTWISRVIHETYLDVNETGTEAAAVTGSGQDAFGGKMSSEPFSMVCNRPFVVAICDEHTGTILFMGTIVEP